MLFRSGEKGVEILLRDAHGRIQGRYMDGEYDRYLSEDNTFIKAALAFDFQLLESIPYEEHDLKPDYIITQTQFIRREN